MSEPATAKLSEMGDHAPWAGHKGKEQLEDYELRFFEHLIAEFEACCAEAGHRDGVCSSVKELIERFRNHRESVTMGDLYELESEILAIQSPAQLRERAPGLFAKYCETQGKDSAVAQAMAFPSLDNLSDPMAAALLRARLQQCLRSLHWGYVFGPVREQRRIGLIIHAMGLALLASLLWGCALGFISFTDSPPFFAVLSTVVYAGLMGGAVSATRRLGRVPSDGDPLTSIQALKNSVYIMYFSPMIGAVFAVVLMLVFLSGILTGAIFPAFSFPDTGLSGASIWEWARYLHPISHGDYGKLFLWSFIAGFAEQLVPDTLDRLVSRANALQGSPSQDQQIQNLFQNRYLPQPKSPVEASVAPSAKLDGETNRPKSQTPAAIGGLQQKPASSVGPAPQATSLAQEASHPAPVDQASGEKAAHYEVTAPANEELKEPVHA